MTTKAWICSERKWGIIGAVRYAIDWEEVKESSKGKQDIEPDLDLNHMLRASADHTKAKAYAQKILSSGVTAYGAVSVQKQELDWFVREDNVAEWIDVGEPEEISDFPD
jgi:hypothetical protein